MYTFFTRIVYHFKDIAISIKHHKEKKKITSISSILYVCIFISLAWSIWELKVWEDTEKFGQKKFIQQPEKKRKISHVAKLHTCIRCSYCILQANDLGDKVKGCEGRMSLQADHLYTKNNENLLTSNERPTARFQQQSATSNTKWMLFCDRPL